MVIYSEYDPFARVYNKHWGSYFIPLVLPILENQILQKLPAKANILDLCCGTGQLAHVLTERGYDVTGLDGSEEMLRYASDNAPVVQFIQADARFFKLPGIYHAVISVFDSLNHILKREELTKVFRNVYNTLQPGGLFFFDLNMEAGFKSDWGNDTSIVEDDVVFIIRSSYQEKENLAFFKATAFHSDNGWQRTDFTLTQRCYSENEVVTALEEAGFIEIIAGSSNLYKDLLPLNEESERGFFICQNPL